MKVRNLILTALFAALTAAGAIFQIPMVPVPITLQLLLCIMAGMLLGPGLGALSQVVYIAIGLLGLPVFAGSGGGISYVLKPSFGYLVGFIAGAAVSGFFVKRMAKLTFIKALVAALAGVAVIYLVGVPYLYFAMNLITPNAMSVGKAVTAGALVFLPGDAAKAIIAALVTVLVRPALQRRSVG